MSKYNAGLRPFPGDQGIVTCKNVIDAIEDLASFTKKYITKSFPDIKTLGNLSFDDAISSEQGWAAKYKQMNFVLEVKVEVKVCETLELILNFGRNYPDKTIPFVEKPRIGLLRRKSKAVEDVLAYLQNLCNAIEAAYASHKLGERFRVT